MRQHWSVPALRPASEVFKILYLKGNAFEMGCQHGECLRDEIAYAIHRCLERFALSQQGWHRDTLLAFAQQLAQGLPDAYREELQGISAGSGASMDDLLLWNFFDDYWEVCGCSAFAASGARTASGAMLVGHNIDFPEDGSYRVAVTIIREPTQGMPRTPVKYSWDRQKAPVFWLKTASDRRFSGVIEVYRAISEGLHRILDRCSRPHNHL